ncbi:MAG: hypothetical protein WA096_11090 [Smithella sp.]|jgi:hypothetical protein
MSFKHTALNNMTLGGKNKILQEKPLSVGEIILKVKNNGKKVSDFQKLFFCYRKPYPFDLLALELIADAIIEGYIDVEAEFISKEPNINLTLKDIGRGRVNESAEHQGMKIWLSDFLETKGINATEEVSARLSS